MSVACLTIYDMLKAADKAWRSAASACVEKTGGRSGTYRAARRRGVDATWRCSRSRRRWRGCSATSRRSPAETVDLLRRRRPRAGRAARRDADPAAVRRLRHGRLRRARGRCREPAGAPGGDRRSRPPGAASTGTRRHRRGGAHLHRRAGARRRRRRRHPGGLRPRRRHGHRRATASADAGTSARAAFDFHGRPDVARGRHAARRATDHARRRHGARHASPSIAGRCVAILATGDELVLPGTTPGADQIVCSNPFGVAAMVRAAGGEAALPRHRPRHSRRARRPARQARRRRHARHHRRRLRRRSRPGRAGARSARHEARLLEDRDAARASR